MQISRNFTTHGYATVDAATDAAAIYLACWDNGYTDFDVVEYAGIYGPLYEVVWTRPATFADFAVAA